MNSLWKKPHKMRSPLHWNPFLLSFLFTLILLSASADGHASSECESNPDSVSLELLHRHDPRIPGNENLKLDKHEVNRERVLMEMQRRGLTMLQMPLHTGRDFLMGAFYVQLRIGTPPQSFWMIADTGSDLAWMRCNDNQTDPRRSALLRDGGRAFCPKLSTTYKPLTCGDPKCKSHDFVDLNVDQECLHPNDNCTYTYPYSHGTIAFGDFGTDVVTLGLHGENKGTIDAMVIGCTQEIHFGSDGEGKVFKYTDGILGIGYSPHSFMYRATKQYGNKFSYCFMDHDLSTKNYTNFITFGSYETSQTAKATLSAPMQRTKLMIQSDGEYGVQVEGISIGGQMLQLPAELWDFKAGGGMTLDTGSSLTFLGKPAFKMIGQELMKAIEPKYKIVVENYTQLRYCFLTGEHGDDFEKDVPKLAFHFAGGAVYEPPVRNYVINMKPNLQCIGIMQIARDNPERAGILGNIMQQFHLWEYDLASMTVGFAPSQCTF